MKYQKIYGKDEKECAQKMRMEYGGDVIPVNRSVEYVGGVFNKFFRQKRVVLTIAIPEKKTTNTSLGRKIKTLEKIMEQKEKVTLENERERPAVLDRGTISSFKAPVEQTSVNRDEDAEVLRRLYGAAEPAPRPAYSSGRTADRTGSVQDAGLRSEQTPAGLAGAEQTRPTEPPPAAAPEARPAGQSPVQQRGQTQGNTAGRYASEIELDMADTRRHSHLPPLPAAGGDDHEESIREIALNRLEKLSRIEAREKAEGAERGPSAAAVRPQPAGTGDRSEQNINHVENALLSNEMTHDFVSGFIDDLNQKLSPEQKKSRDSVHSTSVSLLSGLIETRHSQAGRAKRRVQFIMGPTGVGKTTTVAKLASNYTFQENRRVALVTIDNYRIAATEQLRKYADILEVPVHVCHTPLQFQNVIEEEEAEIILVDTSGRSPYNKDKILELKQFMDSCPLPVERHLVLAANTRLKSVETTLEAYDRIGFDNIILTKLDECDLIGSFVEMAERYHRPFSWLTNGQDVPNDILDADNRQMAELILGMD